MINTIVASKNLAGENTSQGHGVVILVGGKWNTNKLQKLVGENTMQGLERVIFV